MAREYSIHDKDALRQLSEKHALFDLIPQRVKRSLDEVDRRVNNFARGRVKIIDTFLTQAEEKIAVVKKLEDDLNQIITERGDALNNKIRCRIVRTINRMNQYRSDTEKRLARLKERTESLEKNLSQNKSIVPNGKDFDPVDVARVLETKETYSDAAAVRELTSLTPNQQAEDAMIADLSGMTAEEEKRSVIVRTIEKGASHVKESVARLSESTERAVAQISIRESVIDGAGYVYDFFVELFEKISDLATQLIERASEVFTDAKVYALTQWDALVAVTSELYHKYMPSNAPVAPIAPSEEQKKAEREAAAQEKLAEIKKAAQARKDKLAEAKIHQADAKKAATQAAAPVEAPSLKGESANTDEHLSYTAFMLQQLRYTKESVKALLSVGVTTVRLYCELVLSYVTRIADFASEQMAALIEFVSPHTTDVTSAVQKSDAPVTAEAGVKKSDAPATILEKITKTASDMWEKTKSLAQSGYERLKTGYYLSADYTYSAYEQACMLKDSAVRSFTAKPTQQP